MSTQFLMHVLMKRNFLFGKFDTVHRGYVLPDICTHKKIN